MLSFKSICNANQTNLFMIEPFTGRKVTYQELDNCSGILAARLLSRGIKPRDHVILRFDNRMEYSISHFALLRVGAVAVIVSHAMPDDSLLGIAHEVNASMILAYDDVPGSFAELQNRWLRVCFEDLIGNVHIDEYQHSSDELAAIVYTSGTTGKPKGVMITLAGAIANFREYGSAQQFDSSSRMILSLPLDHADGWCFSVLLPFLFGSGVILLPPFSAKVAVQFDKLILRDGGNIFIAVPSMMQAIFSMKFRYDPLVRNKLKSVLCSSAKLHPEFMQEFESFFGRCVYEFYGTTETLLISYYAPGMAYKENSVGKLSPQVSVAFSEDGEMLVHSPFLFKGYYQDDRTKYVYDGTWYRTGDMASLDEDGYVFLQGRKEYMINKSGIKLDPNTIDRCLLQVNHVADATTMGMDSHSHGEQIISFVVLKEHVEKMAIYSRLRESLPTHLLPQHIHIVNHIPRTPIGKVDRKALLEHVSQNWE
ncbi:class I adenylate-forming enzyme family protein [Xylanibacillus composti]|uniref:Long-chain-fatty-acid--CoA ligase n=1 Tax=Xylanibacillus composti TaxID=1572762 RepID=A0A8J4M172_9BACL|nr:class I adenylate-forming enzyme family protein [Xylanibacillus composti]GIQ67790.1 long-chain-fatty-acid--CoA ligase [Xylanibacillus composti]